MAATTKLDAASDRARLGNSGTPAEEVVPVVEDGVLTAVLEEREDVTVLPVEVGDDAVAVAMLLPVVALNDVVAVDAVEDDELVVLLPALLEVVVTVVELAVVTDEVALVVADVVDVTDVDVLVVVEAVEMFGAIQT